MHRAHVDVPALLFGRVRRGQIAELRKSRLHIGTGTVHLEHPLEWVDRDSRLRYGTVPVGEPIGERVVQFAALIIGIVFQNSINFRVNEDHVLRVQVLAHSLPTRRALYYINVAHLPFRGAHTAAAVMGADGSWHNRAIDRTEHLLFTEEFPVVVLILGAEAFVVIGIELIGTALASHHLAESANPMLPGVKEPKIVALGRFG